MVRLLLILVTSIVLLAAPAVRAERTVHTVAAGQTLGRIAKRYNVTIDALCKANGITRREKIKPGQELVIPDRNGDKGSSKDEEREKPPERDPEPNGSEREEDDAPEPASKPEKKRNTVPPAAPDGMRVLSLPEGPAYYYEPIGPGRLAMRPVLLYLHGRGGNPQRDCRIWAKVARALGWLICPSGPGAMGNGRGWNNNWATAHHTAMHALRGLRKLYGRRVQVYGNTLMGFSEGAFVAMNVGIREPRSFNRLLFLAANSKYWGGAGKEALKKARSRLRRVYLITGENDGVVEGTREVRKWLREAGVPTRITIPKDMGHELAIARKPELYRMALVWLQSGQTR